MKLLVEVCLLPSSSSCCRRRLFSGGGVSHGPYKSNPRTNWTLEKMAMRPHTVSLFLSVTYTMVWDDGGGGKRRCQNASL
jgi:hypothetical protein